jgi:Flp pilus assembly pilin Flp
MREILQRLRDDEQGQDIAEYAVLLAVILLIVLGTARLVGNSASNVFSNVASAMQ